MAGPELYAEPVRDWYRPLQDAELLQPDTVDDALTILSSRPDSVVTAGGTYYLRLARFGGLCAPVLVDLGRIDSLRKIELLGDGRLRIGSMVVHARTASSEVASHIPVLSQAARRIAGPAVRNLATIGGNVVIDWDLVPALLAHNCVVEIAGPGGPREVTLSSFRNSENQPELGRDEIVTGLVVDRGLEAVGYSRVARRKAVSRGVASAVVTWQPDGQRARDVRVAVGSTNFAARRVSTAESLLEGEVPSTALFEAMGDSVHDAVADTFESVEAEQWYARAMARVMTIRAGLRAADMSEEEQIDQ